MALALAGLSATAGPARAACELQKLGELPVTMEGLRPMVPARVNGHEGAFLADSGAFHSILTTQAAASFGLKLRGAPVDLIAEGATGRSKLSLTTAEDFEFSGFLFHRVEFLVVDQPQGPGVAGILGQNVLRSSDVEYDLANGAIRFFVAKGCGAAPLAYWADGASSIALTESFRYLPHTLGVVYLNGMPIKAMFDTGAERSMVSTLMAEKIGIGPGAPGARDAGYFSGLGNSRRERKWIAPVASFRIGGEEIRNTQVMVGGLGVGDVDMLVGADFFLSHRIYVSLSQRRMYFTYNGGPVFRLDENAGERIADAEPRDTHAGDVKADDKASAAGEEGAADPAVLARRGQASAARGDYAAAIADLTQAMSLDPGTADYPLARARAEYAAGQRDKAGQDVALVLKLRPDDLDARMMRGGGYLMAGEVAKGRADLAAVDRAVPDGAEQRRMLARIYQIGRLYPEAVGQLDRWIAANPKSDALAEVQNERCWTRALWGQELDAALADCDAALKRSPGFPAYLDSRGLVRLRMGDLAGAIADYNGALAKRPKQAPSLYGRGLAEVKAGQKAAGDADIAAAVALDPKLPDWAKGLGLTP
jgi:tetratricopeptide (TPR) repeat protein/predicted aspartyl protease